MLLQKTKKGATVPVSIRLHPSEVEYIDSFGSHTEGLHHIIEYCRQHGVGSCEGNPELELFDLIILPKDDNLRMVYTKLLRMFITGGCIDQTLDYYYSDFDKLSIATPGLWYTLYECGFVTPPLPPPSSYNFPVARPTIRLKKGVSEDAFRAVYDEYVSFLCLNQHYADRL
jgi:hypothetical protein